MVRLNRRRLSSGLLALVIGSSRERGLGPQPARAGRKGVKFDISASQFRDDCQLAGGQFAAYGGGDYSCLFNGWRMECSRATGRCRVVCDPGVKCIKAKRLPSNLRPALDRTIDQMAPVTNTTPAGPIHSPDDAIAVAPPLAVASN